MTDHNKHQDYEGYSSCPLKRGKKKASSNGISPITDSPLLNGDSSTTTSNTTDINKGNNASGVKFVVGKVICTVGKTVKKVSQLACPVTIAPPVGSTTLSKDVPLQKVNEISNINNEATSTKDNEKTVLVQGRINENEEINPDNRMPWLLNFPTSTRQSLLNLKTDRQLSSIPKTGTQKFWEYPSPLQFFKAMELKNKEPESESMEAVVWVHNKVNEMSWQKILEWEKMHSHHCSFPSLTRFVGLSDDLSFKARLKSLTNLGRPFDRHDWTIDRCGKPVRYIIDYYDDQSLKDDMQVSFDVRPAPDSFSNIWDRIRRPVWNSIYN